MILRCVANGVLICWCNRSFDGVPYDWHSYVIEVLGITSKRRHACIHFSDPVHISGSFNASQSLHYILLVISHVYMICGCPCSDLFTMLMVNKLSEPRIIVTMLIRTTTLKLILKATMLDRGIETVLLICRTLFSIIWAPAAAQRVHLSACQWRFWSAGIRYDRWPLPEK